MEGLLNAHKCDPDYELIKALQVNNADIGTYYGRCIVGNHCMHCAANGNPIIDAMSKAMIFKITDADNILYLSNTNIHINHILKL